MFITWRARHGTIKPTRPGAPRGRLLSSPFVSTAQRGPCREASPANSTPAALLPSRVPRRARWRRNPS